MSDGEDGAEQDADATDHDIGNAQEGIASAHDSTGGDQDRLGGLITSGREACAALA